MAHPLLWPKKTFFYPIGNTPPTCLTQELSPEQSAEILLIACGDPRSILYTVHTDLAPQYRKLDFTCCDWEPAVLARNIILLTMIADSVAPSHAWPIFYHFFLDQKSLDILLAQCRTLIEVSSNPKAWKASKYSGYIRFCTDRSLEEVRRHWFLYLETHNASDAEKKALRASFTSGMKSVLEMNGDGGVLTSMRSAGPLFTSFYEESAKSYKAFWSTGVTTSSREPVSSTPHMNPTFVHSLSGKRFNVHYGTDPLLPFHLAPSLTSIKGAKTPSYVRTEDLVGSAMDQFSSWYSSFQKRISGRPDANIVIRFYVGESLAFCRALHACNEGKQTRTGIFAYPWGGSQIDLDVDDYSFTPSSAPLAFNVIDTSNLTDHAGLLNILLVTVPLLQRKPWSAIHTDTLLRSLPDGSSASSVLEELSCGDIPTLSLMLGVTPAAHLSHFTTQSNKHELFTSAYIDSQQYHELISWKFPSPIIADSSTIPEQDQTQPILVCDAKKLGEFFFSVYLRMFDDENVATNLQNIGLSRMQKQTSIHYLRASLVAFFALVKERVEVDWKQAMRFFLDLLETDHTLMMGPTNYQDLVCQLYLRDLYMMPTLQADFLESLRKSNDRFQGWKDIPPIMCVVLKVPRRHLKGLEDMDPDVIQTPILQCESKGKRAHFHNIHSSIQPLFGDIVVSRVAGETQVVINEDERGWSGDSPLIVTFYMPSWILFKDTPQSTEIGLFVRSTPNSISLASKLGMMLTIYATTLADTTNLHFVRHRPGNHEEVDFLRRLPALPRYADHSGKRKVGVSFDGSGRKATALTVRHNITEVEAAKSLSDGAVVTTKPEADSVVLVTFKGYTEQFVYPFPVRGNQLKTRVARKSSYIEIEGPIRSNFADFLDLSLNPFPISLQNATINLFNIHHLNLDCLPAVQFPMAAKKLQWLSTHMGMTMSKQEKTVKERPNQQDRGVLVNLKESIATIFIKYSGLDNPKQRPSVFGLTNPEDGGGYALIFVNDIKLDLASHTVVADACVIPLYTGIIPKVSPALQKLLDQGLNQIVTLNDETRAWRMLLPALAERCRTWKHLPNCEYPRKGIPVALDGPDESPLCSCGKGKNLGSFATIPEWTTLQQEATRIAIGPLFTFSFMDNLIASSAKNVPMEKARGDIGDLPSSSSTQCANCGNSDIATLLVCSACKKTKYCSRSCQKTHWKAHKLQCISG